MSDLVERYNSSNSPRVQSARDIPNRTVNFFDQQNVVQDELKNFPDIKRTRFVNQALNSFDDRIQNFSLPEGFNPLQPDIPFNRWGPSNKYYTPGQQR